METLHEHNQKTYENICRMYSEGIQRVAVVQPTGSGKSLLMAKLIEDNPDSRFFILSTSHKINDQFKSKLDEKILDNLECNIYWNMPNMKQEVMESLQPDYIFLDEMHRALAKEWSKGINVLLNMYPDAKVLGLSATPIRYLDRCRNVVEELFDGNLACDMSLSQAILDGILPMARYVCGVYSYEKDTESLNKKIERSCNSEEEKKELLKELKILKENLDKGHGVSDIFRKYIVTGNEKFVVFLKDTTHLRVMKPVIEKWFMDAGFAVRLYEVHSKNVDKDKEFLEFTEDREDGIIKLCLSVAMLTEGIHGDIDGVIMLRETMSPNLYFQMIGRAFSCGKKTIPLIFDLVANSQFISDTADNFPNELRGEIKKRKEECEKECKEYEVGFDVDEFIVMDYFMDVVSGFKVIEGRLIGREWTEEEDEILFKFYPDGGAKECIKKVPYRSKASIIIRANSLGITTDYYKRSIKWDEIKIKYLLDNYENPDIPMEEIEKNTRMKNSQIRTKACELGLKRTRGINKEIIDYIKVEYPKHGAKYIAKKFNITPNTIYSYVSKHKISYNSSIFTDEVDNIIKEFYPKIGIKCAEMIPELTKKQIFGRAKKLGIKVEKKKKYSYVYREKGKYVVQFTVNGKVVRFGTFIDEDEAGRVAMEKAKEYGKAI